MEILKLLIKYKANDNILPDCLSKNIFRKRVSSYSLRGQNVASIPRYNGRLLRDSLAFCGSALWNLVNCNDKLDNLSKNDLLLKKILKTFSLTAQLPLLLELETVITYIFRIQGIR